MVIYSARFQIILQKVKMHNAHSREQKDGSKATEEISK